MLKTAVAARRVLRAPEVRGANRAAILGLLQHNDYLSRADVARHIGLSEGAISRIVTALLEDRLVREDGAASSTGGRPGRRLALERRRVIFGAEIQNWETRCAVSTMNGRIADTSHFRTLASVEETLKQIVVHFERFKRSFGENRLPGLGIAVRGIVNSDTGMLVMGGRPNWKKAPIKTILESLVPEPVFVENNVRAAALAEYTYGPTEVLGSHCFVFVKIDEGVGMGLLLDGKLYHGPHMAAGELGQVVIEAVESSERHDRPGCLERLISNAAICDRYAMLTGAWQVPATGDTSARVRRIVAWAKEGDAAAKQTIVETARYLGIGISNLIWGLDADSIVIDAVVAEAWQLIEPELRKQLPYDLDLWGPRNLLVKSSALGGEAALLGAAALPLSRVFAGTTPAER